MSVLARRCAVRLCGWAVLLAVFSGVMGGSHTANAQAPAAPAAAAPAAAAPVAETAPKQSSLMWLIHTSGWIGGVLLLMSFYFVAQVVRLFQDLRPEVVMPQGLIEDMDKLLAARDYPGILRIAKESQCELGQLVTSGITSLSSGLAEARESVDRMGEVVTVEMEKRISMLAVIGSLGPLIGLLGTLKGMISSFSVIASGEQMKAAEVAFGISEALVITFEGVALSVPAIFLFAVFKNRVASLSLQAIAMADEFLIRVHASASRGKSGGAPTAAPAAPQA